MSKFNAVSQWKGGETYVLKRDASLYSEDGQSLYRFRAGESIEYCGVKCVSAGKLFHQPIYRYTFQTATGLPCYLDTVYNPIGGLFEVPAWWLARQQEELEIAKDVAWANKPS